MIRTVAAALALAAVLAGCGTDGPAAREADTIKDDSSACARVDAPMTDIQTVAGSEPRLRIPRPAGWEPTTDLDGVDVSIRFTLVGDVDSRNVAVVTLERVPAPDDADAQTIFTGMQRRLRGMLREKGLPTNVTWTPTTVCGLPAQMLTRPGSAVGLGASNMPAARPLTALYVVAKAGVESYLLGVSATTEPDGQRDADLILSGFQVLPPAAITG